LAAQKRCDVKAASRLINSGARIRALLDDLVDFNRPKLGIGIRVSWTDAISCCSVFNALPSLAASRLNSAG
jgi:hypothetical protein